MTDMCNDACVIIEPGTECVIGGDVTARITGCLIEENGKVQYQVV